MPPNVRIRAQPHIHSNPLNTEETLLHHFASRVSLTLSDRTDFQTVWASHVPRDGYDHPHLMHSMLAVAALHLAYTVEPREYSNSSYYKDLAIYHHDMALSLLRPHVTTVTIKNFDAIYASSTLTFLFNAGLLKSSNSSRLFDDIVSLSELGKGVLAVREEGIKRQKIRSSYLVRYYLPWDDPPPLPDNVHRTIKNIEKIVNSLPETGKGSENKTQYLQAAKILRMTFNALKYEP